MLFSSITYIFLFLPICFFIYFLLNKLHFTGASKLWLCIASLFFYGYWEVKYLPVLLFSIVLNFSFGNLVSPDKYKINVHGRKLLLTLGVFINILILAYYKYSNFFIDNVNLLFHIEKSINTILLPLGISFFTFTQIAFLIDSFKGKVKEFNFINYSLFVTFFPHLIAGPILHHAEMMPQFSNSNNNKINYSNVLSGIIIFAIGLIKKIIIADGFAVFANEGFSNGFIHDFYSAWTTSISYTFQLYFDFSGYCDMAVGSALLFNIKLPINFNSPYKATDIQDFWRRWHITLGRYLRDYIYIPLGGNRVSKLRNYFNLFITFAIAGLWHGASWMFILWGALHGAALIIHRIWDKFGIKLFKPLSWFITFMFINSSWVFFRSENINQALEILSKMLSFSEAKKIPLEGLPLVDLIRYGNLAGLVAEKISFGIAAHLTFLIMSSISFFICTRNNSQEIAINNEIGYSKIIRYAILSSIATYLSLHSESAVFLYFNF